MKGFRLLRSSFPFSREIARANERKKPRDLRGGKNSWKKKKEKKYLPPSSAFSFLCSIISERSINNLEYRLRKERERERKKLSSIIVFLRNFLSQYHASLWKQPRSATNDHMDDKRATDFRGVAVSSIRVRLKLSENEIFDNEISRKEIS